MNNPYWISATKPLQKIFLPILKKFPEISESGSIRFTKEVELKKLYKGGEKEMSKALTKQDIIAYVFGATNLSFAQNARN